MILIIAEKPKAAKTIAEALGPVRTKKGGDAYYYEVGDGSITVASGVGHVYGLVPGKEGWDFPIFDVVWEPKYKEKGFEYTKSYISNIKELSKSATEIIIATDYDVEGGVIGYNLIKFATGEKFEKVKRMKFSTLTHPELLRSFKEAHLHNAFEKGMIDAGLLRHYLDWFWGINLSRALVYAYRSQGNFKVLSTGRVQGPTLKILVDREREIKAFKTFYIYNLYAIIQGFTADGPETDDVKKAIAIFRSLAPPALVNDVKKITAKIEPPGPFNLTDLQTEASRVLKFTPKQTLEIAQRLYEDGLISYPRTSSQKLPKELDLDAILRSLSRVYAFAGKFLGKKPKEGEKTDPAHPAIYPTGEIPRDRDPREMKVFDLVARRFIASFSTPAIRESTKITLDISGHEFTIEGRKTLEKGFTEFYPAGLEESDVPSVKKGDRLPVDFFELKRSQKKPPKRYTAAGLLKLMEKLNIGTKATRADIIERLYDRKYIEGKSIEVTALGESVITSLESMVPDVVSVDLTREFEDKMDAVSEGREKMDKVLEESKVRLTKILEGFRKVNASVPAGTAPAGGPVSWTPPKGAKKAGECDCGGTVFMLKSSNDKNYAKCDKCGKSWGLPQKGTLSALDRTCSKCKKKIIQVKRKDTTFTLCMEHGFNT